MVKVAFPLICVGVLLQAVVSQVSADTLILKTGEELHGTVMRESDTEVVMELQVADGIIDQQVFPKDQIKTIAKTPKDQIAYEQIQAYRVGAHSVSTASYDRALAAIRNFMVRFPDSSYTPEAKKDLDALKQERARVAAGAVKWNNRWYTPEEAAKQKYQLGAHKLFMQMREQASRYDFVGALNTFDQIEERYPGSRAYPDAVEFAISLIQRLDAQIDRAVASTKLKEQRFEEGIVLAAEPKKSQILAARKAELAAAEAALASAERSGAKWKPLLPVVEKSPTTLKTTCASELQRLNALPVAQMRNSLQVTELAYEDLAAKNLAGAEAKYKEAQTLWSANELLEHLEPELAELKVALKPTPTPSPSPTPKASGKPATKTQPAASPAAEVKPA